MDAITRDRAFVARLVDVAAAPLTDLDRRMLARLVVDTIAIAAAARRDAERACAHNLAASQPLPPGDCHSWGPGQRRARLRPRF